jgi:hypothetical protein
LFSRASGPHLFALFPLPGDLLIEAVLVCVSAAQDVTVSTGASEVHCDLAATGHLAPLVPLESSQPVGHAGPITTRSIGDFIACTSFGFHW